MASSPAADAPSVPSTQNTPSDDAVTVKKNETLNAPHPSKRPKIDAPSPEHANALQQGQIARPDPRNVRGRRGHLKQMLEIPLDALHEIFHVLEPADLLHLSWASKNLNAILMEKSSRYIWKEAFERLYRSDNPPPRCPEDLNLAQYARFLFEKKCSVCDITNGYWCSWMMRLRVCWNCLCGSEQFIEYGDCHSHTSYEFLFIRAKKKMFYWMSQFSNMKTTSPQERRALKIARTKDTDVFQRWESNRSDYWKEDLSQRRAERKTAIINKLKESGWEKSDIKAVVDSCAAPPISGFMRVKKLTNSDWKELQPRLVERLQKLREEELAFNKKVKLSKRWEAFCHQFNCWNEVQTIEPFLLPHVVDLVVRAPFRDIVFTPSLEDGDFTVDEIDRVAKEWMADRDSRILSLLPGELQATLTDENGPHEKVASLQKLPLASLFFRGKSVGSKTVDQVYGRRLSIYDFERAAVDRELRSHATELRITQRPWDWDCYDLGFDLRTHEIAKDVIMLFGKDPLTATLSEMSQCEQIFECLTCGNASSEWLRVKETWSDIVAHDYLHSEDEKKSKILSERWSQRVT